MEKMDIRSALHLLLILFIMLAYSALVSGCQGSTPMDTGEYDESKTEAGLSQTVIWENPEKSRRLGAFSTDEDGNQYYIDRGTLSSFSPNGDFRWEYTFEPRWFLTWDICGKHIRLVEQEDYDSGNIQHFYIRAIGQQGETLWRTFLDTGNEYVRINDFTITPDGWTYFAQDKYLIPEGEHNAIVALDPEGEISWTAVPDQQNPDSEHYSQFFVSIKPGPGGTLLALDEEGMLYLYGQLGNLMDAKPSSQGEWDWGLIREADNDGFFITSDSGGTYDYSEYFEMYSDFPDYYIIGVYEGNQLQSGDTLKYYSYDLVEQWSVLSRSLITTTGLDGHGGVIIGGYAGEVASFDSQGQELWRVMPDQEMEARYSWEANFFEHPGIFLDTFVGVSTISVSAAGDIVVSTNTGLLYAVEQTGDLLWCWRGVTGSPYQADGFGIGPFDYTYPRGCSGLAWDEAENLQCSSSSGLMTISPVTGKLVSGVVEPQLSYVAEAPDGSLRIAGGLYLAALDAAGAVRWEIVLPDRACARPVVDAGLNTYIPTARGGMCKVDGSSNLEWEIELAERVLCTPAIGSDGNILAMAISGELLSISPAGSVLWSVGGMNQDSLPAAACPAGIAAITDADSIAFINYQGAVLWDYRAENPILAPPSASADSVVFAGDSRGVVYAIDSAGTELFKHVDECTVNDRLLEGPTEIQLPPLPQEDGSVIVEFAPHPFHGDMLPVYNYSVIKCLSATGELLWQVPEDAERPQDWDSTVFIVPGLIDGEWIITGHYENNLVVNSQGVVLPLQLPEDYYFYNALARVVSSEVGFFTLVNEYTGSSRLLKSVLQFH